MTFACRNAIRLLKENSLNACLYNASSYAGKVFSAFWSKYLWGISIFSNSSRIHVRIVSRFFYTRNNNVFVAFYSVNGNPRFFGGVVPLVRNGCVSHMAWKTSFFVFVFDTPIFELTFDRCKNSKTSHALSSITFILQRGRLSAAIQKGSTKSLEIKFLWIYCQKRNTRNFSFFCCSILCQRNGTSNQKTHFFGDGMNLGCWVYVVFLRG